VRLEQTLLLNRYFLQLLGVDSLDQLKKPLLRAEAESDEPGRSAYLGALGEVGEKRARPLLPRLEPEVLEAYDARLMGYQREMAEHREGFRLKYFQYLALLFTEVYLDRLTADPQAFRSRLNDFLREVGEAEPDLLGFPPFAPEELRRLAFFMATGSGKTLLLHLHLRQIMHYLESGAHPEALVQRPDRRRAFDNILLVTPPGDELSGQHLAELAQSGLIAERLTRESGAGSLLAPPVRVIEVSRLALEPTTEGVSVPLEQLGSANLVFVDEGHKGAGTDKQAWKAKQKALSADGMLVEYSATFAQAIAAAGARAQEGLRREYGKAILFDYSYRHFYYDGYGKDFRVISGGSDQDVPPDDLLMGGLLLFAQQRLMHRSEAAAVAPYQVEPPLWVFLGGSVAAGVEGRSDISKVVRFLRRFLTNGGWAAGWIAAALSGESPLTGKDGDPLAPHLRWLRDRFRDNAPRLYQTICDDVFHGRGGLELRELKEAEGEIALRVTTSSGTSRDDFGVINIGDVGEFKSLLAEQDGIEVLPDRFTPSLFARIKRPDSPVNLLIGSKKFIEGWSSWRVSCMGLLNIARGEGPQFLQLFGRGVRLKGRDWTLKRSGALPGEHPPGLERLETLYIAGWNAEHVVTFRKMLDAEEIGKDVTLPVRAMDPWPGHLRVPRLPKSYSSLGSTWTLDDSERPVTVDWTVKLTSVGAAPGGAPGGIDVRRSAAGGVATISFAVGQPARAALNEPLLYAELAQYKAERGYGNVFIPRAAIGAILERSTLLLPRADAGDPVRLQSGALAVLEKYLDAFVRAKERAEHAARAEPAPLEQNEDTIRPYSLRVPASRLADVRALLADASLLHRDGNDPLPRLVLDRHLFTPLLREPPGAGADAITVSPPALVPSEEQFVRHLRSFWQAQHAQHRDLQLYLLRNLSRVGVGLFQRSGFYPDFLLWLENTTTGWTRLLLIEPHGMGRGLDAERDKINALLDLERMSRRPEFVAAKLAVEGYIITPTPLMEIDPTSRHTAESLECDCHIYIQDPAGGYLGKLLLPSAAST
jgi:hypothetical protein